jgi:hypothetical protein
MTFADYEAHEKKAAIRWCRLHDWCLAVVFSGDVLVLITHHEGTKHFTNATDLRAWAGY